MTVPVLLGAMRSCCKPCGAGPGHRLMNAKPDACCGAFDEGKEIVVVFLESGRDGPAMLAFRQEPFDPVASSAGVAVEDGKSGLVVDL